MALLSLSSAMIAPTALPAQPNDPSPQDGSIQSGDSGGEFALLLLSVLAGPEPLAAGDDAVNSSAAETVSTDEVEPEFSAQMLQPPTILLVNPQPPPFVPPTGGEASVQEVGQRFENPPPFVPGLTTPSNGLLNSSLTAESPAKLDSGEVVSEPSAGGQPSEAGNALSQFTAASVEEKQPGRTPVPQTEPLAGAASPEPRLGSVRAADDATKNLASAREAAEKAGTPELRSVENELARASMENDSGERKNTEPENRQRRGQPSPSSHVGNHSSADLEIVVPPGPAVADRQVATQVDQVSLMPGERSRFFAARDDVRQGVNETEEGIKPGAQAPVTTQGGSLHGVEREGPAKPAPANAFASAIERVAAEISTHVSENRREVVIQLEPPELGGLKIDLALDGDRLQARIAVEVAETGALLQKHLPELRHLLQEQNLDLIAVRVDVQGGPAQGSEQWFAGQRDGPAMAGQIQAGDESPTEAQRTEPAQRGTSAVSVWA